MRGENNLIFVIINGLFNGWLLTTILQMAHYNFASGKLPYWEYALIGYGTAILLTLLGLSKVGHVFLKLFLGGRDAIGRERNIIDPLLKTVLDEANLKKGTNFTIENINLLIKDIKDPNALAFGYNTIMLTDGLLKTANEEELKAVIAHEVGHLYYKDSVTLISIVFGNFATRVCMWLYAIYAAISTFVMGIFGRMGLVGCIVALFAIIPLLVFLPVVIINWVGQKILEITLLWHGRKAEYRADKFADELGFGPGLIGFLEKIHMITESDNSFFSRITSTHPAPMKRIGRLEA